MSEFLLYLVCYVCDPFCSRYIKYAHATCTCTYVNMRVGPDGGSGKGLRDWIDRRTACTDIADPDSRRQEIVSLSEHHRKLIVGY